MYALVYTWRERDNAVCLIMYRVVGCGRGFGRHSGRWRRSVASSVGLRGVTDDVASNSGDEQE